MGNSINNQELVNEIRQKTDIVDLISEYIPLVQKGKNYFGVCPFHNDTNPLMSVSREKQIYKCFSCGAVEITIEKRENLKKFSLF